MEIRTKKELKFVINADRIMNGCFGGGILCKIKLLLFPNYIISFLKEMRIVSYYKHQKGVLNKIFLGVHYARYRKLGLKLGFSIGYDSLGYGVVIPHYGTIVIGGSNRIGNYAVLHTSTCISDNGKNIGDGLYLSTGAKITSKVNLGNGISIGANSLVNKDCVEDNVLLAGMPAKVIRQSEIWYIRDSFDKKVERIEELKKQYGI
ncbi:hypothetical protein [Fibrobacter sp. UWB5]|uniref:hypothetical protein n=1 Tax=Fibrobacter sp. UWB5 TaxID=1964360 RepID=UPI000B522AF6|nr:hypothetical protein [Fibrobacter sp. UWB5]OWV14383.1 hypothetical protein B7989_02700 [Fibrobacter sp. UWB5]